MPIGVVKFYNDSRGFGFLTPEDGTKDVFIHVSATDNSPVTELREGMRLYYEIVPGRGGRTQAGNIKPA